MGREARPINPDRTDANAPLIRPIRQQGHSATSQEKWPLRKEEAMAMSKRIALIVDCDGTIAEDTTTRLLEHLQVSQRRFWHRSRALEADGWDPTLAYMSLLIEQAGKTPISADTFARVGKKVKLSPGIPRFFLDMKAFIRDKYARQGVSLDVYVASGGIEDIIRATPLTQTKHGHRAVDDVFACTFAYDEAGNIAFPKRVITFTEKTKVVFAINKGIGSAELAKNPYRVNDHVPPDERQVLLKNMIYIGDGPSDVAYMSLLKQNRAEVFAVYTEPRQGIPKNTYNLARQGRFTRGPFTRDYRPGSDLRRALESELEGYAQRVISEAAAATLPAVRYTEE